MASHLFEAFLLIFTGSAIVASIALYTRQPLLVAYVAIGILFGPFGLKIVPDIELISEASHIGIVFLLFLLGLDMQPRALQKVFKEIASIAILRLPQLLIPILAVSVVVLAVKPCVFYALLNRKNDRKDLAWDIGFRFGQMSEFSLLLVMVASTNAIVSEKVTVIIQSAAIITFLVSSYTVIFFFPNPIAVSEKLRRD